MYIEERNVLIELFDIYGKLLSKKQFEVMDKFLNFDLGESELAELYEESRQSIHDAIIKAKKQLFIFEEKCNIYSNNTKILQDMLFLKNNIKSNNIEELINKIDNVIDIL